jgi:hypothetical protein
MSKRVVRLATGTKATRTAGAGPADRVASEAGGCRLAPFRPFARAEHRSMARRCYYRGTAAAAT